MANSKKEIDTRNIPKATDDLCPIVSANAPVGISMKARVIIKKEKRVAICVCERPCVRKKSVYVTEAIVPNPCRNAAK